MRDRRQPVVSIRDFMHATLLFELLDRIPDVTAGEVLDDVFEGRVALAKDLIEPRYLETRLLQLMVRSTSFDGMMLANVANEQHAILGLQTVQKAMHLPRTRQAGFIEHIQTRRAVRAILLPYEMMLQRVRGDAGFAELLRGP